MAARAEDRREPDPGGLRCDAERLEAVLRVLECATDPNQGVADLKGELQLALIYELMPLAVRKSHQLAADLGRLDELYARRAPAQGAA